MFMMVDDLWLYQYHQQEYEGIIRDVFRTISFIEEKQWEIVGLGEELEELKEKVSILPRYNPYSNKKFMAESRSTNLLLDNLFDFLLCSVPLILAMEFLFYRIFYCLFNYEISKFLRPYSFCLVLVELIFQNNLEYITFLTFRSFQLLFFFDGGAKTMQALTILFGLTILLVTICSYLCYYYQYGKLARYFLSNMYRFKSSYVLMTITFGIRPFFKGLVHAAFF